MLAPVERRRVHQLMTRLKAGDRTAFDPVFTELRPLVLRLARRMVGPAEAEDVAQASLLRLFQQVQQFDPEGDAVAWAMTLTAWECRTARRRRQRRREDPSVIPEAADPESEERLLQGILQDEAQRVLQTLSSRDQQTLAEAFRGEGTGAAFRQRKSRALARLKRAWRLIHG